MRDMAAALRDILERLLPRRCHSAWSGRLERITVNQRIERRYRTNSHAAIGGSSLGGLAALYLALRHPDVFSAAAVMSPSVRWNGRSALPFVDAFAGSQPRLWVDIGGREGGEALGGARWLRDHLLAKGWHDLHFEEDRRAGHSGRAWARRIPRALEFLFPTD